MRLFGTDTECGPLLDLGQIQRQLRLGSPVPEGLRTIAVTHVIGTLSRAQDFDVCFRARHPRLRKSIDDIQADRPASLDAPIDVVRIDRAFFVADGHKRMAIARETGQEFIDAHVSRLDAPYELTPDVDPSAIARTAREGEFRRHSGIHGTVPDARFALTDLSGYGELLMAVQGFAFEKVQELGRPLQPGEAARLWYEEDYQPTVARGREVVAGLLDCLTDADVYLTLHRQWRAWWGSECDEADCLVDRLIAERRQNEQASRSLLSRALRRSTPPASDASVLPLAGDRRWESPESG